MADLFPKARAVDYLTRYLGRSNIDGFRWLASGFTQGEGRYYVLEDPEGEIYTVYHNGTVKEGNFGVTAEEKVNGV